MSLAVELHVSRAGLHADELVVATVRLLPDLLAGAQRHEHELRVLAGEQHATVVLVLDGVAFDVRHISGHDHLLWFCEPAPWLYARRPGGGTRPPPRASASLSGEITSIHVVIP